MGVLQDAAALGVAEHKLPAPERRSGMESALNDEDSYCCDEEESQSNGARKLCSSLAMAVVMRQAVPDETLAALAALPAAPCALSLGLASDEVTGLVHLPNLEQGSLVIPSSGPAGVLQPGTAAWESFSCQQSLLWCRHQDSAKPKYEDWAALLKAHGTVQALLTVPLVPPGVPGALGAATFALSKVPEAADVDALRHAAAGLAAGIAHHTKHVWEEALGFLTQVIPRRVVQRMLSAALTVGPLAAADAAPQAAAACSVPTAAGLGAMVGGSMSAAARKPGALFVPGTPGKPYPGSVQHHTADNAEGFVANGKADVACCKDASKPSKVAVLPQPQSGKEAAGITTKRAPAPSAADGNTPTNGRQRVDNQLRQKWNLEFADPTLEETFKCWFNTMQTKTDLGVMKYLLVLLAALVVALGVRGHLCLADVLAMTDGMLSVVALAVVMLCTSQSWYIAHRSAAVAYVRIAGAAVLLMHFYKEPGAYSGSLLRVLTGTCCLTLVLNSFRNRLRFSNHVIVQLAKLYLAAVASAFVFSDPQKAAHTYLSLPATTLAQLAAALLPSLVVYHQEADMRREFLRAHLATPDPHRQQCLTAYQPVSSAVQPPLSGTSK